MAPPQLARDAPVADVLEPAEPRLLVLVGVDLEVAVAHRVGRSLRHPAAVDPPLRLEHRLDDVAGARALAEPHLVGRLAAVEAERLEPLEHLDARVEAHHPRELAAVVRHLAVLGEDRHLLEPVPAAAEEIVRVVRRRHLHRAGPEAHVDERRVGDQLDAPLDERVDQVACRGTACTAGRRGGRRRRRRRASSRDASSRRRSPRRSPRACTRTTR